MFPFICTLKTAATARVRPPGASFYAAAAGDGGGGGGGGALAAVRARSCRTASCACCWWRQRQNSSEATPSSVKVPTAALPARTMYRVEAKRHAPATSPPASPVCSAVAAHGTLFRSKFLAFCGARGRPPRARRRQMMLLARAWGEKAQPLSHLCVERNPRRTFRNSCTS